MGKRVGDNMYKVIGQKYELVLGFNTKQYWIYDNDKDIYIDPPKEFLNKLDTHDQEKSEEIADKILTKDPKWLYDTEFYYDGEI